MGQGSQPGRSHPNRSTTDYQPGHRHAERLAALGAIEFAISEDANRAVRQLVEEGWPAESAAFATAEWWIRVLANSMADGLEGTAPRTATALRAFAACEIENWQTEAMEARAA